MEPNLRNLPVGFRFRPTDFEMSKLFLKKKALGQASNARSVPEDCHDIFSRHPSNLPGDPKEKHRYYYCRKHHDQVTTNLPNLWTQIEEETNVFENDEIVGIKRQFTLMEQEEEEEESPKYKWFLDEISLPVTVADSDWVMCHVFRKKIKLDTFD